LKRHQATLEKREGHQIVFEDVEGYEGCWTLLGECQETSRKHVFFK
jgi:hypothetical protein